MDSARRRTLVISFVSFCFLSFLPSLPFLFFPRVLFPFLFVLAHAPFGRLVYIETPKLPLRGTVESINRASNVIGNNGAHVE
jgi:hypothetical protein